MLVPLSVLEFRDRAAAYFGTKVGVVDGDKRFTYAQFGERTHRLASALEGLGVGHGDRVSFLSYNCHQLLEAYYGVLEAGAVLNPINVRLTPREIGYILQHSGTRVVFYHKDFTPLVEALRPSLPADTRFVIMEGEPADGDHEYEALLATGDPGHQAVEVDENEIAELFYTSGTTGQPKGVALTHRTLHLHAVYAGMGLRVGDTAVALHVVPLFHVNGWGTPHYVTMFGGTHVMLRRFDPAVLLGLIQAEHVTHVLGVPTIFNALINLPTRGDYDLSSLITCVVGGAPSSPTLIRGIERELKAEAIVGYGLSETSPVLTLAWSRQHLAEAEGAERTAERKASTGWAIPGVRVRVVDPNGQDVRADGEQLGEIVARSNVVMAGYYRDDAATATAIRDGWFHTGDMATIDAEGYVTIKDRSKDVIIRGGENISSVEIENALAAHPAVLEAAVVAVPDKHWGESPVGLVVLKEGAKATPEELLAHCRTQLAGFKVPRDVEIRDALPKGGTGKILKGELREPFWTGMEKRVG
jgi:fatty-acyl-CoA synthase